MKINEGHMSGKLRATGVSRSFSVGKNPVKTELRWQCMCECGRETWKTSYQLRNGVKSCGCLRGFKHGHARRPEYQVWASMKDRCNNPNSQVYEFYGGRGIQVCKRWLESFENFIEDVGDRPSKKHSLDRKNNDGDYEPENVWWTTSRRQGYNRRSCRLVNIWGITMCVAEWCRFLGKDEERVRGRLKRGMDEETAIIAA